MATIFFDTCAIDHAVKQGKKGSTIKKLIVEKNRIPVVGISTLREIGNTYLTNCQKTADENFLFIEELQPDFMRDRAWLYLMEGLNLKTGNHFDPYYSKEEKEKILKNLSNARNGQRDWLLKFCKKFESELKLAQKVWSPSERKTVFKKYKTFLERIKTLPINEKTISELQKLFKNVGFEASEQEIRKFITNKTEYPALMTLFHATLFLEYLAEKNGVIPKKDRITDAIQLTEASYCVTFVTADQGILDSGKWLNSKLEIISLNDFLSKLESC